MKKKNLLIWIFLCSLYVANAQESMIADISYPYLEKLINTAKKNYPEVQIKKHQVAIAKNNILKTTVSWLDAFNFSYFYRPSDKSVVNPIDPYIFNGYQVGININIGTLIQKPFTSKEAKEQYKVTQFQEQQYNLSIESEVKKRYFTYIEQRALLKLRTKSTSDAENLGSMQKNKFEKGEIGFDDYNKAILQSTEQNQFKIQAESGAFIAKASLEEILGDSLENIK
jgi:outer membrane protein TolC